MTDSIPNGPADPTPLREPLPFASRHVGPRDTDVAEMLALLGLDSLEALVADTVPHAIRQKEPLALPPPRSESEMLRAARAMMDQNEVWRSFIGMGYYDCHVPPVIQRNILENPGWYTQYTPYQAEISQGRLEALLNFQTMVADLTGLPLANASLLDEATAAAEAMSMCHAIGRRRRSRFVVAADCHPQTVAVVETRAHGLGLEVVVGSPDTIDFHAQDVFGVLLQYPTTDGRIVDYRPVIERAHAAGALVVMAADLLALVLLRPPGELGADIAVGSTQRFGVPLGYGGPHAAYLSTQDRYKRQVPGRIVGVSRDAAGRPAYRLAIQTREQHIRRDKATSNICTAQVLLAIMAGMYAAYHGPDGLRRIAQRVRALTLGLARGLEELGLSPSPRPFFDTLKVALPDERSREAVLAAAAAARFNLRVYADGHLGVSLDEATTASEVARLLSVFAAAGENGGVPEEGWPVARWVETADAAFPPGLERESDFLSHEVFNRYHSEHEMLRYIHRLQSRDLSLTTSMIPLGSCTMKLNATAEMMPVSWDTVSGLHPFAPEAQARGYRRQMAELEQWLCAITGFDAFSFQPNAGSQGEYTGLLVIRAHHRASGDGHRRDVCLIPESAHGTNPASAVTAGLTVVGVACEKDGDIDVDDMRAKAEVYSERLAALMITYPSTHGVFEERVAEVCEIVHHHGGLVYMDGANLNAQVGLCRPADYGADVCHLNLHKTFCIPHGGGGPGVGPIGVTGRLAPYLPGHPLVETGGSRAIGPVAAAPYGSPSILPISWVYIGLMGASGLTRASQVAVLNANYMAKRLEPYYRVLFTGRNGRVAHEFVLDMRPFKASAGVEVDDIAKRLMDYGFHAPTMSWPVPGTLMVEPTESESKAELDRFCDAMIAIREEIRAVEEGRADPADNPLKHAPHTAEAVSSDAWSHPYSREQAAFPAASLRDYKYWPPVGRIDNAFGDRNLVCVCPPVSAYVPST